MFFLPPLGDIHQTEVRFDEEGVRAECPVRLRDRSHYLQPLEQAVSVRQHRHGQGPAQVHRVQRATREPDQCRHYRGKTWEHKGTGSGFNNCTRFVSELFLSDASFYKTTFTFTTHVFP